MIEQVRALAAANTRIAIHAVLEEIYEAARAAKPRVIVELGVSREALANKVLAWTAQESHADFVSCDLEDFAHVCSYSGWRFVRQHDVDFGLRYDQWREEALIPRGIDVLLIDTDELYQHTRHEISAWFPHLAPACTVLFRCTNLRKKLIYRDGTTTMLGWDNQRGVVRAVEEYLGQRFNEAEAFSSQCGEWRVTHSPWGAGLTVMRRGP